MKKIIVATLLLSFNSFAQFTVAPFGSTSSGNTPIGENQKNQCSNGRCAFELTVKPFCYGANLRSYPVSVQMNPSQSVTANIVFTDKKSPSKKDTFQITFPARMTYASAGSRTTCSFEENSDMTNSNPKTIACFLPWMNKVFKYTLYEWKARTNPQNRYSNSFNSYMGIGLPAKLQSGQGSDIDAELTCLYMFTSNSKNGQLINSSVSCYFPSRLPDLSEQIVVKKDGATLSTGDMEVQAHTNLIKIKLKKALNSMSSNKAVKHGQIIVDSVPASKTSFTQPGSSPVQFFYNPWFKVLGVQTTPPPPPARSIAFVREKEAFDEANAYQSFTSQIKFPGMQGFCGGYYSPLMLFFDNKLPKFTGVSSFPLYGMKEEAPVNWPERNAPGYFLALLKDGEKEITHHSQLFGQNDKFNNGFDALKVHDDNNDNVIDSSDRVFSSLVLWNDKNGNGYSEASEIKTLQDKKVTSIGLKYTTRDQTNFSNRARAREKGKFTYQKNGKKIQAQVFDVWLAPYE